MKKGLSSREAILKGLLITGAIKVLLITGAINALLIMRAILGHLIKEIGFAGKMKICCAPPYQS